METREYFRIEATELIARMTADLRFIAEHDEAASVPHWKELRRSAHTLKGAAHVVRETEMAHTAHDLEDALSASDVPRCVQLVDVLAEMLERAFQQPEMAPVPVPSADRVSVSDAQEDEAVGERAETVRVELRSTDELLAALAECNAVSGGLRLLNGELAQQQEFLATATRQLRSGSRKRSLESLLEAQTHLQVLHSAATDQVTALSRILVEAERLTKAMRLAPAQAMLLRMERIVRRTAEQIHVQIECVLRGGEERVDLHVLAGAEEALSHMARNAVTHGLRDKRSGGRVEIGIRRSGALIEFFCIDNGCGIDTEHLRKEAVTQGWMTGEEARNASREHLLGLLSRPGVTTYVAADQTAGRGIGLHVARNQARHLRGELVIVSEMGKGTEVLLRLPENLFSVPCVVMSLGGTQFAVPSAAVEQTMQAEEHQIQDGILNRPTHAGPVPVLDCARLLGLELSGVRRGVSVVVKSAVGSVSLEVDRVLGMEELVTEAVPENWAAMDWIAGIYRDASGQPRLLLDPAQMHADVLLPEDQSAATDCHRLPLLVIDDSLTSRMLQESILSSAGYQVETANSAEDALKMAAGRDYGMYLVDVEMPGMDGFEFVATTRANERMRHVPVVMVTSRNLLGDRDRGLKMGASDYIVKGDFDQGKLLATVARLTAERSTQ